MNILFFPSFFHQFLQSQKANENDQRTLTEESSVVINRFHRAKTYTLTARVGRAKGKISIVNMVKDKLDHIVIKKEEQVLVDTTDDVEDVEFDEAITMTTTKEAYIDDGKLIVISSSRRVKEVKEGAELNFYKSGKIYFFSEIDNYPVNELNTLILKHELPKEISQYEILSVLGKQIETNKTDDDTLLALMPKDASDT